MQDIDKIGKKHEVKEVADGYARNFLITKGLAKPATQDALKWLETEKTVQTEKAEQDLKRVQGLATTLDGQEIIIPVKVGEERQLFEAITSQRIFEKLKEMGFEVKKTQILLDKPIKELGEFPVKIRFSHNLEAEIKVIVIEEK